MFAEEKLGDGLALGGCSNLRFKQSIVVGRFQEFCYLEIWAKGKSNIYSLEFHLIQWTWCEGILLLLQTSLVDEQTLVKRCSWCALYIVHEMVVDMTSLDGGVQSQLVLYHCRTRDLIMFCITLWSTVRHHQNCIYFAIYYISEQGNFWYKWPGHYRIRLNIHAVPVTNWQQFGCTLHFGVRLMGSVIWLQKNLHGLVSQIKFIQIIRDSLSILNKNSVLVCEQLDKLQVEDQINFWGKIRSRWVNTVCLFIYSLLVCIILNLFKIR